ncbi:hypothetical protein SMACR_02526 [Sordaria macrospora]|uniref:RNI-like protein n=1 Tax=Sordaria macrospora TaxID=5147 RepID=A0A8S8ZRI2_SORMA|nr:hypothetical protein SMACR_02526 [Sordaria macrospora]KAH7632895.1 hypothetical protein B0T09DRAFT_279633 [Sordaria sp. MPI-SDFR-AT-0083]WPJ60646.1 hypothetical protein SMAC4_02526 [Sordaria macrospora]
MSRQQSNRAGRQIRGPQSALTDFLASHNISANQIRLEADARRRAAEEENGASSSDQQQAAEDEVGESSTVTTSVTVTTRTSRRQKDQKVIDKIKASKNYQKRKRNANGDDEDDDLLDTLLQERAPLPGQMDNCANCGKRFTVTAYSRNHPDGGLLCGPCGKEMDKDAPPKKKPAKRAAAGPVGRRRQIQSKILDGTFQLGAKSLMTLCIETLAKNIDLAEDLGDLPQQVIDKIARKLSKHRLLNSTTLSLFLQPTTDEVCIYDGAKLSADDYIRIFQTVPGLKKLKARNAIHFKDEVMDFLISRKTELEDLYLHGSNLIDEEKWLEFLGKKGKSLQSLRVYWTDKHFGDSALEALPSSCPSLVRLKACHNQKITGEGIKHLAQLKHLKHISIDLRNHVHSDVYVSVLSSIGKNLETFSITREIDLNNTVLDAIHNHCRSLQKLRITDSEVMTDEGFARLFTNWENKSLQFVDLQKCRQVDSANPRQNPDKIGLCDKGFKALMAHSRRKIEHLNVHGCRHISAKAFEEVFPSNGKKVYPELKKLEISFCEEVSDFIVGSIFKCCPNIHELNVFGCMNVKSVRVPKGKILVGVPNALGMVIEGIDDIEV